MITNNRFAALIDNNNNNNSKYKNRDKHQKKFYKEKKQNRFKHEERKKKNENIDLSETAFPSLVINADYDENDKNSNIKKMSYIEKIKYFKELNKKKEIFPPGWVVLGKNTILNEKYESKKEMTNPYYNPINSVKILEYRYYNRCELNSIVGDVSEYWNMDEEYEFDTRDLEENIDDDYESDSNISDDEYNDYL